MTSSSNANAQDLAQNLTNQVTASTANNGTVGSMLNSSVSLGYADGTTEAYVGGNYNSGTSTTVTYKDPLDFSSYVVNTKNNTQQGTENGGTTTPPTNTTPGNTTQNPSNQPNTGTTDQPTTGGNTPSDSTTGNTTPGAVNTEDVNIDFDKVDEYVARIGKYFKNINNELNKVVNKLTKVKTAMSGLGLDSTIDSAIKSCKKRVTYNNNKVTKLQSAINADTRDMMVAGQKQNQELAQRMAELEKLMAAQIVYNDNVSSAINGNHPTTNKAETTTGSAVSTDTKKA